MLSDLTLCLCRRHSRGSCLSPKVQSLNSSRPVQVSNIFRTSQLTRKKPHHFSFINPWSSSFAEKTPLERAKFLESTDLFANIHAAAASGGQTAVPDDLKTDLHFTCFVQAPEASAREAAIATGERRLIELDGGRAGPVDRGESTDLLEVRTLCLPSLSFGTFGLMEYVCGVYAGRGEVCERADHPEGTKLGV